MNYEPAFSRKTDDLEIYELQDGRARVRRLALIIACCVAAILLIAWFTFSQLITPAKTQVAAPQVPHVSVMSAGRAPIARVVTTTGTLAAKREMPVGVAGDGGMVTHVMVEPGDWVRQGQVLATIEHSVQSAQINASAAQINVVEANARLAQNELDRAQALVSRGFISKADVDRKTAARDAARAQVGVARAQLGETTARSRRLDIRAPAAGLVLSRTVEPGQVVGPASGVLFRIARDGEIELKAQLAESDLAQINVGAHADVTPIGAQTSFGGRVWQIAPIIDPQTRQGVARIALAYNRALRPGGFAAAKLSLGTIDAPLLPQSAVLASDQGSYVYIVNSASKVEKRAVVVGDVSDTGVAITQGLDGSERVIVSAGAFVSAGEKVLPVMSAPVSSVPEK
jgi:RND family efflux transporter MFP subunit